MTRGYDIFTSLVGVNELILPGRVFPFGECQNCKNCRLSQASPAKKDTPRSKVFRVCELGESSSLRVFPNTMSDSLLELALNRSLPAHLVPKKKSADKGRGKQAAVKAASREADYAKEARSFLQVKESRVNKRVQLINLAQPKKKNKKALKKLIKIAQKSS